VPVPQGSQCYRIDEKEITRLLSVITKCLDSLELGALVTLEESLDGGA
jgi:hypothetical protein